MRYSDLLEDIQTTPDGIKNILQSLLLSLLSSGIYTVPINSLIDEIQQKTSQNMPANTLSQLLQTLPIVKSVDTEEVQLNSPEESQEDSSAEKVEQMANGGDYSAPQVGSQN